MEAAAIAKRAGAVISYDPNYRASLWKDEKTAVEGMKSAIPLADVMKVSDEECLLMTGAATYEEAADQLLAMGPKLVAVTLGGDGVLVATKEGKQRVQGFKVPVVDTTGAGDTFNGAFATAIVNGKSLADALHYGNAAAALSIQRLGAQGGMPTKDEVTAFLAKS